MMRISAIVKLFRPVQWVKNGFVFLPLFFGKQFTDMTLLTQTFVAFISFCLAASGVYCLNDVIDVEADRLHPKKRLRPIASGEVSVPMAYALSAICFVASILVLLITKGDFASETIVLLIYIGLNILYCYRLKRISILDMMIVASGFVLRLFAGSFASGVVLSAWIVLMTFLLALFLAVAKRRDDVAIYEATGQAMRRNIVKYNLTFMNIAIGMLAAVTLVCYIMYTLDPVVVERCKNPYLYLTSLWVLAGLMRYLQITFVEGHSGSPTKVLVGDRFIWCCIAGWIINFAVVLYI